jgi:glyoxylase-like metal-dependent hydrolase (beta-lactamase superfamily II)
MKVIEGIFIKKIDFKGSTGKRSVYTILIKGEKNCLIDTGTADNFDNIKSFCEDQEVNVDDIDIIINTHCHPDHIGCNYLFKKSNPNIIFYAHRLAKPYIEDIEKQYKERPITGFFNLISNSIKIDKVLEDGDIIDIGMKLRILHTPGHSKGSISIFVPEKDLLIIGDVVPERKGIPIYENVNELKHSFLKLKETEAKHVISSFDGYCKNISDVVNNGKNLISNVDRYVIEYLTSSDIHKSDDLKESTLEEATVFVLNKLDLDIKPTNNIKKSIMSHIINNISN